MTYSCSVKTVSRSGGCSATAAAAYRNAELVEDQRTGERHDYTRRSGVESVSWFAPAGCQEQTSAELWNRAEAAEMRKNATVAREVLVALPHELNQVQRTELVQRMTQRLAERYGVAGTAAIHAPDREGDQRNWHTHILMTTRRIDSATGELGAKTRELDDLKTGPAEVVWIRQMVEREGNAALERAGHAARLDCRSLADQGIEREPTTHEGPRVTQIRRECEQEQRGPLGACDVILLNDARRLPSLEKLQAEVQQLDAEIIDLTAALDARRAQEIEEAHAAALAEDRERAAREVERAAREVERLDAPSFYPPRYAEAVELVKQQRAAKRAAERWRAEHPLSARALDAIGLRSPADREADRAREARQASPAVREASEWQRAEREREQQLSDARQRLSAALERMPPPIHAESDPPTPDEPTSAQQSLAAGIEAIEQAEAAPEWVEWEDDAGELYGQWEGDQQVYWLDDQGEWLRAEDRPQPEPERQRYSGPRIG